jgi:hypothetical protein
VTSLDELKLRIVVIETVASQMLENTWTEIEYRFHILRTMKGALFEVVSPSELLILQIIKLLEFHFHIP